MTDTPIDWRLDALCADSNPDLWFPEPGQWGKPQQFALDQCKACPVREICLENLIQQETGEGGSHGTGGGLTAKERAEMIRVRSREAESEDSTPLHPDVAGG
jgi:hypothetical protein